MGTNDDEAQSLAKQKSILNALKDEDISFFRSLSKTERSEALSLHFQELKGDFLLQYAAAYAHPEVVSVLAEADSTKEFINGQNQEGWAPIHFASFNNRSENVDILIANGADVNLATSIGRTALHIAAGSGIKIAEKLINSGANINVTDQKGYTPLNYATRAADLGLCKLFLENGAEVDAPGLDQCKRTPLMNAVLLEWKEVALLLIEHGANHWTNLDRTIRECCPKDLEDAIDEAVRNLAMTSDQPGLP